MTPPSPSISAAAYLRSRSGRVCVALRGSTIPELLSHAEAALADATFFEFRLDHLAHPARAIAPIGEFLSHHKEVAAIATCCRKAFGGAFEGSLA